MIYSNIIPATFIDRPNRFVAHVLLDKKSVPVHVKNTGRCKELLVPGARAWLEDFNGRAGSRKLMYDLIAVEKNGIMINMDSMAPNKVVRESLLNGTLKLSGLSEYAVVRPETVWGDSRFDFYVRDTNGKEAFIEVKGVTLEDDGIASFPDAPTERGIKHLKELTRAVGEGYRAYALFVIQMAGMKLFRPNDERHAAFGAALRHAADNGVTVLAIGCDVTPETLMLSEAVPIDLA